jgi:drug/metabolite transporter (DMT)-like permease
MITASILAAIGAMFCWGFGDFFIQKSTRKIGDVETLAWIGILGSFGVLPFVWHELAIIWQKSNFQTLLLLGIITSVVSLINFEALRRGKLSVIEVLLEFELPITVILAIFFFNENLGLVQTLFVLVIFCGVLLIAIKPSDLKKYNKLESGALLALSTAVGYGLINFLTAVGAKETSPLIVVWVPWVMMSIISLLYLLYKGRVRSFYSHALENPGLVLSIGVLDTLAWVLFAIAVQRKELAVTIAITESYPAISLFLGVAVNRESITKYQIVGAILTISASIMIGIMG